MSGYAEMGAGGGDCDDANPAIGPTQTEGWLDDGVDNDCDGFTSEAVTWSAGAAYAGASSGSVYFVPLP